VEVRCSSHAEVVVGGYCTRVLPSELASQASFTIRAGASSCTFQAPASTSRLLCLLLETSNHYTMSLDPPTYLTSVQNNIRARPIPWDGAVRAGTVSEEQLSKIRAVDKVRKEQRKQIVEADLENYQSLFFGGSGKSSILESAARSAHVAQYVLVLLGDLLDGMAIFVLETT
jgi:hypothetical protein